MRSSSRDGFQARLSRTSATTSLTNASTGMARADSLEPCRRREVANGTVTPRRRKGAAGSTETQAIDAFVSEVSEAIRSRRA